MGDVRSRFVDVGGIRTHYLEAGDGYPVVLLHSGEFGASAELTWERNIAALAEHFRVIAPDWLGFGRTDKLHDFVSGSDRRIRHMAAFLRTLDVRQAFFAGCSMGGTQLVREAARSDCRLPIRAMAIISGGGFVPDNADRRAMLEYDGTEAAMARILRAAFHDPRWAEDREYVRRRVRSSLEPGAWETISAARLKAPNVPARTSFGQEDRTPYEEIPFPTLVVVGAEDKLRLPGYHHALERIPQVETLVVLDAGHLANIERAESVNPALCAFFRAVAAGTWSPPDRCDIEEVGR